jgi:hypothetical protein
MLQRVLSPVLVGRQEELSQLEDALLSVNRGDGCFVLLAGASSIRGTPGTNPSASPPRTSRIGYGIRTSSATASRPATAASSPTKIRLFSAENSISPSARW